MRARRQMGPSVSMVLIWRIPPNPSASAWTSRRSLFPMRAHYLHSWMLTLFHDLPVQITRERWWLGSETAEKLEPIPGLLSSRVVIALHENILFTLRFHPAHLEVAKPELDALTQTVTGSFAFLPGNVTSFPRVQTVSWLEFGEAISLSYDSLL